MTFDTIEERRNYVRQRLIEKGDWEVPPVREEIQPEEATPEILLPEVSMD